LKRAIAAIMAHADIGPYWLPVIPAPRDRQAFPPLAPNRFVDVAGHEETCLKALACHVFQGGCLARSQDMRKSEWGVWKGMCGLDSAEAFLEIYPRRSGRL
jgi:hypothetical protein